MADIVSVNNKISVGQKFLHMCVHMLRLCMHACMYVCKHVMLFKIKVPFCDNFDSSFYQAYLEFDLRLTFKNFTMVKLIDRAIKWL